MWFDVMCVARVLFKAITLTIFFWLTIKTGKNDISIQCNGIKSPWISAPANRWHPGTKHLMQCSIWRSHINNKYYGNRKPHFLLFPWQKNLMDTSSQIWPSLCLGRTAVAFVKKRHLWVFSNGGSSRRISW